MPRLRSSYYPDCLPWVFNAHVCNPSFSQSSQHNNLDSEFSFPVTALDMHPVIMLWEWCKVRKCRVVLADFTLSLLVPFVCVLHVRVPLSLPLCFIAASSSFQMSLKCSLLWMLSLKWLSGCCNFYSIHYSSYHTVLWLLPFLISAYLWTLSFPWYPSPCLMENVSCE